jgi:hypothetical protein
MIMIVALFAASQKCLYRDSHVQFEASYSREADNYSMIDQKRQLELEQALSGISTIQHSLATFTGP